MFIYNNIRFKDLYKRDSLIIFLIRELYGRIPYTVCMLFIFYALRCHEYLTVIIYLIVIKIYIELYTYQIII